MENMCRIVAVRCCWSLLVLFVLAASLPAAEDSPLTPEQRKANEILQAADVQGGLIVHLGCGDGKLTAALGANDRYVVHGIDSDPTNVENARAYIQSAGQYGRVSIERFDGQSLPYADNLVNLIVVQNRGDLSTGEVTRVLCPNGVALALDSGLSTLDRFTKPWPDAIDEWTHFLYDATGNAVAKDERVGPPRHLQWTAGPKRTRDHDALASFTTMTSSKGRIFYILDEGPTSQIHRQPQWRLVARDAFNGVPLWKREIGSWVTHLYNFRTGPAQMTRRLVSVGDRVYVTLGYDAAVTALDAASGETLFTYDGSKNTEEIILQDDVLLTVLGDPKIFDAEAPKIDGYWETRGEGEPSVVKSIAAYRASTGDVLWNKSGPSMAYLVPLSLTAGAGKVFYLDRENLHCVDLRTGASLWTAPYPSEGLFLRNYAPTVVLYKDVIVCLSIEKMAAFSASDGRQLWKKEQGYLGFGSAGDLFVIDDLVWTFPGTAAVKYESKGRVLGNGGKEFWALDLYTGEVKQSIAKKDVWPGGHHHRCYRNKATEHFAVCGRRGLEFVDLTGGQNHVINWWVRGICQYGIMPCNGMVYVPPDPCQCFSTIKVDGLLALAADSSLDGRTLNTESPLHKGPAFDDSGPGLSALDSRPSNDWPTYRRDMTRSGSTTSVVPSQVEKKWESDLGGTLSSVVVAQNRVLVSAVDRNTVHCLDATTGKSLWRFTAGGSVDSPPTASDGLAVFGSRDGRVYALNVADGRLAWSYRAGPCDRRIVGDGRLESVWPIHGSVLVLDGVVYFAAGRSSFLDGGIRLYGLDVHTGEKLYETLAESIPVDRNNSGALPDILVSDGTTIQMRQLSFDKQLQKSGRGRQGAFSARTGFLEDEWGHRLTWRLGQASGNLLVFDDEHIYGAQSRYTGWKKNKENWPPTHTGHLHQKYSRYKPEWFPIGNRLFAQKQSAAKNARRRGDSTGGDRQWAMDMPSQIRALVQAGDILFASGWPDAVTIFDQANSNATERELQSPKLWAISTKDGYTMAEYELDALPVFDGVAVAYGRLFMTLQDGKVICFGE